ncbi:Uncharacterised protein [BD1-7 clade bacterium]|uniref:SPOR domain-containing protein n=1 Tax=BD1-7 clade bacterium TaxID=2029982 RepID=A0A5S9N345_9GAMM|nr:Uncharacterised protein [BD1-7 clade bacterium]CAA0083877.1 Uncharacterised protein [BD1-7 clade bacterium]
MHCSLVWYIQFFDKNNGLGMRWILYFLVVINLLAFAWFQVKPVDEASGVSARAPLPADFDAAPALTLKSELSARQLVARDTRSPVRQVAPMVGQPAGEAVDDAMCLLLGPYPEVVSARSGKNRLVRQDVPAQIVELETPLQPLYWVYVVPLESRQKAIALLLKLQGEKVDSFMVTESPYENAISLGLFSKEDSANRVMAKHLSGGLNVKKTLRERTNSALWLAVQPADLPKISPEVLNLLANEDFSIKKQEKRCKSVALLKSYQ